MQAAFPSENVKCPKGKGCWEVDAVGSTTMFCEHSCAISFHSL